MYFAIFYITHKLQKTQDTQGNVVFRVKKVNCYIEKIRKMSINVQTINPEI